MTQHEFDETTAALECAAMEICGAKRPGYTVGSEDVLANFKRIAELTKTSPEQVCMTYFMKHIYSVVAFLTNPTIPQAEPIQGRMADIINYTHLLYALIVERAATT